MAAALALVLVYGVVQVVLRRRQPRHRPSPATDPTTSAPASPSPPRRPRSPGERRQRGRAGAARQGHVVLRATDRSWVQVTTASGQELFQGLLQRRHAVDLHRQDPRSSWSSATPAAST